MMHTNRTSRLLSIMLPALLLVAGCVPQNSGVPTDPAKRQEIIRTAVANTVQALTQAAVTPTPDAINAAQGDTNNATVTPRPSYTPLPTIEAVYFDFPTQGPLPVSAWRPPLYPAPWALGEYDHFYFQRPIAANEINWPVADYRYGGIFFDDVVHSGVDIDAPLDTPVMAAADGQVIWAGYGLLVGTEGTDDGYGLAVAIKHDFGYEGQRLYTIYAHMSSINVVDNQMVKTGEQIGYVGTTGHTTGPHLHFEVREGANVYDDTRNPELWLAPPQGWGILVGRIMDETGKKLSHIAMHVKNMDTEREWEVRTYGIGSINSDDHYNENLVLSDLPAGKYKIWIDYKGTILYYKFQIYPGSVTFITFNGEDGFQARATPTPRVDEIPTALP
jgi:murein DD-endopeptidase MepM/ murein hydrolase activator NlpD